MLRRLLSTAVPPRRRLHLHDVTPRDGLQNERAALSLQQRASLVRELVHARADSVEVCSFVRADLVPNMAGSPALCRLLAADPYILAGKRRTSFSCLVPNLRGFEAMRACNENGLLDTVAVLTSCSESHSLANVNMSIKTAMRRNEEVIAAATEEGLRTQGYASLAFGCPFEGRVDPRVVREVVSFYIGCGVRSITLADTFGHATTDEVNQVFAALEGLPGMEEVQLGLHMHNANGRAVETLRFALGRFECVKRVDAAVGGTGGCNFIKDAKGNVATEAVVALAREMGLDCGMDEIVLREINQELSGMLQRRLETV